MANRSTSNDKVKIDPLFSIPHGAEDEFAYSKDGEDTDSYLDISEYSADDSVDDGYYDDSESFIDYDDGSDDFGYATLATPDNFSVISQQLRRAPGGQQVVDVILQVEDIDEAINYEIQVTKA